VGWIVESTTTEYKIVSSVATDLEGDVDLGHDTIIPIGIVEDIKVLRKRWWL
jgi:hypothetical protein